LLASLFVFASLLSACRFAADLEADPDPAMARFLRVNRERVKTFIDKPLHELPYQSYTPPKARAPLKSRTPGEDAPASLSVDIKSPFAGASNLPEFDSALGSRSRFGDGDGSFFDRWLTSDLLQRNRFLVGENGLPTMQHSAGPTAGFKCQYMFREGGHRGSDKAERMKLSTIRPYAERRQEWEQR
jgi:hypothetical protein